MSLNDKKVALSFEVKAAQLEAAWDKVRSGAENAAKSAGSFGKSLNDSINAGVDKLGKLNQAFEGVGKIVGFGEQALKAYGERIRLEAAAGSTNIGKLEEAFGGLVNRTEVLKFAAQAQNGALKLTQEQMEKVAKATVGLSRAGFDQEEVFKKLTEAAVKAKAEGLDDYGMSVKEGANATETLNNVLAAYDKKIAETAGLSSTAADDIQQLSIAWENAKSKALEYAGAAVFAFTRPTRGMEKGEGAAFWLANIGTLGAASYMVDQNATAAANASIDKYLPGAMSGIGSSTDEWGNYVGPRDDWSTAAGGSLDATKADVMMGKLTRDLVARQAAAKKAQEEAKKSATEHAKLARELAAEAAGRALLRSMREGATVEATDRTFGTEQVGDYLRYRPNQPDLSLGAAADSTSMDAEAAASTRALETGYQAQAMTENFMATVNKFRGQQSWLETTFGSVDEISGYSTAFGALQGATTSAMQAWISGSMSLGLAVKKGIGDSLAGVASQLGVESLKHAAYAVGSLAFGDLTGVARHGAASAAFGAGAVAAAAAAKKLGASVSAEMAANKAAAGGGGGAGGGRGASSGTGGGSGGGGTGQPQVIYQTTIVYSDHFSQLPAREKALQAQELVAAATGGTGGKDD